MPRQYSIVKLNLTDKQIRRLINGHTVRVEHHQLLHGHEVALHKTKANKIHRAHVHKRGVNLSLAPDEIHRQGGAFLDKLKQFGSFLKDKVFNTDLYKQKVAPAIRQGLHNLVDVGATALASKAPQIAPALGIIKDIANKGV